MLHLFPPFLRDLLGLLRGNLLIAEGEIRLPRFKPKDIVLRLLILRGRFVKRGECIGIQKGGVGLITIKRQWEARSVLIRGIDLV